VQMKSFSDKAQAQPQLQSSESILKGLRSKRKEELLLILQQVRDLHNATDVDAAKETT
ncbi:25480_t:CDS:2, partial [Racocetra persica]